MSIGQPSTFSLYNFYKVFFFSRQLNFIRAYLRTLSKEGSLEEERIMMEIKIFSLASHLFWSLWSIVNAKLSQIPFGYWVCILFGSFLLFDYVQLDLFKYMNIVTCFRIMLSADWRITCIWKRSCLFLDYQARITP